MSITNLFRPIFGHRYKTLQAYAQQAEALQRGVLSRLMSSAQATEWGKRYHFAECSTYEQFSSTSPITSYDDLKSDIDRMRHGVSDVLWPGRVRWYAKSSGTTSDKSKFIPVSSQALKDTHYQGGKDCVAFYLHHHPDSSILDGRALILGGSHAPNYNLKHSFVGDLSAILIENINPFVNFIRVPSKRTALLQDFEEKRERIAHEALHRNVTNLSGVPSWMLSVLTRVLELSGKQHLTDVWPNLEVFFHGGVAFTPYREQYLRMIPSEKMSYMETYNASEGFFGIQSDPDDASLLLMIDYGVFFEFIAMDEINSTTSHAIPLWEVQPGKNYAMVITTSSGLWRYMIGDTVRFTSTAPYKFVITGRTKFYINAFGEELIVDNAEKGLAQACAATGAEVLEYTAAPVFMDEEGKCRHQWLIEFSRPPADTDHFAGLLDIALQTINSDYEAKRFKDITLQRLELIPARRGLFNDWLKQKGKLGGQHKVPRLSNDRVTIEEMIALNK